jgi:outer membrane lipoprotein SlyB
VVEGVREYQQKGKGTGLGVVAGGVAGAAVGNQFGHGNGKAAMTILGAIGGGMAGNEVEKRVKSETVYEVRVRMDDGSVRTLTQKTAPTPGTRVTVEGNTLRTSRAPQGESQMVRTSAGA